jgi:RNA polymerase sigma factor (sigma-70 family)
MESSASPLAVALETVIREVPDEHLGPSEPAFRAFLKAQGRAPEDVLRELSDGTLAVAVRKRFFRNEAFEEWLVNRHEEALWRWFYRWTGDAEKAAELTQALYVKLLTDKVRDGYDPDRLFLPWLWKVARHLCTDHYRRAPREGPWPTWEQASRDPSPEEEAFARELGERAEAAMAGLSAEQRNVLRGAMGGASADDLARELGLPKSRVYRLLFLARRRVEGALRYDSETREVGPRDRV